MPIQTTKTGNIYFPDGAQVLLTPAGETTPIDLGAINSAVTATLNYTENQVITANAGELDLQIREMSMDLGFTLINLNPINISKLGGGVFETVETAGVAVTTSPDQDIAAGWSDSTLYDLVIETSPTDSTILKASAKPTLTSVTLDPDGTPEGLTEDDDYVLVENPQSASGWSIQFISSGMTTITPTTFLIRIDYSSVTPVERTTVYAGHSTKVLANGVLTFRHTDDNGLIRELNLFSVAPTSGGFQFNFKGANEDSVEEMPITLRAKLDVSRTNGRQLMSWVVDSGAA